MVVARQSRATAIDSAPAGARFIFTMYNGALYGTPFYLVKTQTFFVKLNKAQPHCIEQIHEILRNG